MYNNSPHKLLLVLSSIITKLLPLKKENLVLVSVTNNFNTEKSNYINGKPSEPLGYYNLSRLRLLYLN